MAANRREPYRPGGPEAGPLAPIILLLNVAARFIVLLIGLAIAIAGALLSLTIIGAVIGIPLLMLGITTMSRAFV